MTVDKWKDAWHPSSLSDFYLISNNKRTRGKSLKSVRSAPCNKRLSYTVNHDQVHRRTFIQTSWISIYTSYHATQWHIWTVDTIHYLQDSWQDVLWCFLLYATLTFQHNGANDAFMCWVFMEQQSGAVWSSGVISWYVPQAAALVLMANIWLLAFK